MGDRERLMGDRETGIPKQVVFTLCFVGPISAGFPAENDINYT